MKASDPLFPNSTYYKNVMNKLGRQISSRYYVTAKNAGRMYFLTKAIVSFLQRLQENSKLESA